MYPMKGHTRRMGWAVLLAAGLALAGCGGSGSGLPSGSRPTASTGGPSATRPTLVPPTTLAPTTSTERPPIATTTPNTSPSATTSSSSTPWGWIIGGVVVVAALVLALVLFLRARSRRTARTAWSRSARPAVQQAASARDLLQDPDVRETLEGRESVDAQVERAAKALDQVLATAPDDASRRTASTTASSLRGLMFAFEAERLLRSGDRPPTAVQLADADATKRARSQELDLALDRMTAQVGTEEGGH